MSGDDGLRELRYLTTCRCDEAWTGRGLHESHCASEYAEDVEAVAAELAALRAKAAAVDRVEAALSFTPWHVNTTQMRQYIRAALDGESS